MKINWLYLILALGKTSAQKEKEPDLKKESKREKMKSFLIKLKSEEKEVRIIKTLQRSFPEAVREAYTEKSKRGHNWTVALVKEDDDF